MDTAVGKLRIRDEKKSGRGMFAIRPEHIRIQKEADLNTLPGVVQNCIYRGEYVGYQVAMGKTTVRTRLPATAEITPHSTPVQVALPMEYLFEVKG